MSSKIEININTDEAKAAFKKVKGLNTQTLFIPAAKYIKQNEIDNPPPKKRGAFSKLATLGQKRAYWAKVASGQAQHGAGGYIRSGKTTGAWKIKRAKGALLIQNSSEGAQWVYGESTQQPFHAIAQGSGFLRVDQADQKYGKIVTELVDEEIERRLK